MDRPEQDPVLVIYVTIIVTLIFIIYPTYFKMKETYFCLIYENKMCFKKLTKTSNILSSNFFYCYSNALKG